MTSNHSASVHSPVEALSEPGDAIPKCHRVTAISGATRSEIEDIAARLRDVERYESLAFGHEPTSDLLSDYAQRSVLVTLFKFHDRPTFVTGFLESVPGVYTLWGFGTDDTSKIIGKITRLGIALKNRLFEDFKARRLVAYLPTHPMCHPNIRWLIRCGMRPESVSHFATVDDGSVLNLAITKEDFANYVSR